MKNIFKNLGITVLVTVIGFSLAGCAGGAKAASNSGVMSLDRAIAEAGARIDERIESGAKIALLNFSAPTTRFTDYVLSELEANILDYGNLLIIDRKELDLVRGELAFQTSGEVSDRSMQEVGQMLGAKYVVSGSLSELDGTHRMVIRVLAVETAAVSAQYRTDIANDSRVQSLLTGPRTPVAAPAQAAAPRPAAAPTPAPAPAAPAPAPAAPAPITVQRPPAPAAPAALRPGTYTFYPRPRAMRSGIDIDLYLDKIVIRSGFMNIFLVDRPDGRSSGGWGGGNFHHSSIIQDLDRPARSFNASGHRTDDATRAVIITFENVTATRFSFRNIAYGETLVVFEEIVLGDPD